ncbi:past-1 [Cladochytrium replicatum]|nr:past-1 [Cladochytrium replicatum]
MLPYAVTQRTGPQQQAFRSRARRIHPNDNLSNKRHYSSIIEALQSVYKQKIKPLEQQYHFDTFHSTCLTDADVGANPRVLLLGQYGVGKSTFVKYVLRRDNPGINIGFAVRVSVLEDFTLIVTPGFLSGKKQRVGRAYEFTDVIECDEFKRSIVALRGHDEKISVVLNKPDMINAQQLMRCDEYYNSSSVGYGALTWSLDKVFETPEVTRVYLGSFWDQPLHICECEALLHAEQKDLLEDLRGLPHNATIRKINELAKKDSYGQGNFQFWNIHTVHALIISHLKAEMPQMWGKGSKQNSLIENLEAEFEKLSRQHQLAHGDFPHHTHFKEKLANHKIDKFTKLDKKMLTTVGEAKGKHRFSDAIGQDLPKLTQDFPQTQRALAVLARNPFEQYTRSPTESEKTSPPPDQLWSQALNPVEGKVSGNAARPILASTGLDQPTLAKIRRLADWTQVELKLMLSRLD